MNMHIEINDGCVSNNVVIDNNLIVDNYDELEKRMPEIVNAFMKNVGPYAVLMALMEEFGEYELGEKCPICGDLIRIFEIDL